MDKNKVAFLIARTACSLLSCKECNKVFDGLLDMLDIPEKYKKSDCDCWRNCIYNYFEDELHEDCDEISKQLIITIAKNFIKLIEKHIDIQEDKMFDLFED